MADYFRLYFGTADDIEEMLATLGDLLTVTFVESDQDYADYLAHAGRRHFDVLIRHSEGEDDPTENIPFTAMPHVLTLRGDRDMDEDLRALGTTLLAQLAERGYVPACLLHGCDAIARADSHATGREDIPNLGTPDGWAGT